MHKPYKGGSSELIDIGDNRTIEVFLPPVGMVYNKLTGELEKRDILYKHLPKKEQYWKRLKWPENWEELRAEEEEKQEKNPQYRNPILQKFINQHWDMRINGFWYMNNGSATYLTGTHFYYLQTCKLDHPDNDGYPFYYDISRRSFYFREYCMEDPLCLGYINIGPRGIGKTSEEICSLLENMTKTPSRRQAAIQSKSEDDARTKVFKEKIVPVYNELPYFFKPISNHGSNPEAKLSFFRETIKGKGAKKIKYGAELELQNIIYPVSAKETALDGGTYADIFNDEIGKCLKINTLVRMHDGSVKKVQDVLVGDLLMGDDSTPREVLELFRGQEMMYDIVPNKGETWGCNESHILSLKLSSDNKIKGYKKNDTINITVRDYLQLNTAQKAHTMQYMVGVEYPEQDHVVEPYFLGIWCGDGDSRRLKITNADIEVEQYFHDFADKKGYTVKVTPENDRGTCNGIVLYDQNGKVIIESKIILNILGLKLNKHIPQEYLIDSRENRLQLLAGLLDTDGNLNRSGNRQNYEITQKSKKLALQIKELALSLGFYASFKPKMARMKRKDGSVYECEVYRVFIYGEIYKIPCKVARRKAVKIENPHKNTRNPLRTGFEVVPTGVDDFYGFSITGNRLFLLGDFTVTHNTDPAREADVYRRMNVNRFCVYRNNVKRGLIRATTTVEEIEKGGKECKMVWDESDFYKRTGNGYTISGLYRYFISALDTATQFVDKYGFIDKVKALEFHMNEREGRKDDPVALSSYIRKNPFTSEEAFRIDNDKCVFNAMVLNDRLGFLNLNPNLTQNVDLDWEKEVDGPVTFKHNSVNGKFEVAWLPPLNKRNQVGEKTAGGIKIFYPKNDKDYCIGSDPISFGKTVDGRKSNAATYAFRKFDFNVDQGKPEANYESHNFMIEYIFRPQEPEIFYEDMIKLCRFLGCKILVENQKNNIFTYFKQRGYGEFIMHRPETTFTKEGPSQDTEGIPSSTVMIDTYTGRLQTFVNKHGHRVPFKRLIRDWLEFDPAHPRKFDATVASGFTLLAREKVVEDDLPQINYEELFDTFDNTGISSSINRH